MRATTNMALKPYLEAIRRTCSPLTKDQLLEYCKTRYNRHTAFRNEVKQAVKESPLLRGMEAGL